MTDPKDVDAAAAAALADLTVEQWQDCVTRGLAPPTDDGRWAVRAVQEWLREHIASDEAARIVGVRPKTFSGYVAREQAPPATVNRGHRPLWTRATILHFSYNRPGRGRRTDL